MVKDIHFVKEQGYLFISYPWGFYSYKLHAQLSGIDLQISISPNPENPGSTPVWEELIYANPLEAGTYNLPVYGEINNTPLLDDFYKVNNSTLDEIRIIFSKNIQQIIGYFKKV